MGGQTSATCSALCKQTKPLDIPRKVTVLQTRKTQFWFYLSPVSAKITLICILVPSAPPYPDFNVGGMGQVGEMTHTKDERLFRRSLHSQDQRFTSTLNLGAGGADNKNMWDERYFRQHR